MTLTATLIISNPPENPTERPPVRGVCVVDARARRPVPSFDSVVQSAAGEIGDDTAGGAHQRHARRVIPHVVPEADRAAQHAGGRVGQVDCRWRRACASATTLPAQVGSITSAR